MTNQGTLSPGNSAGTLEFSNANYAATSTSIHTIELGGTTAGTFDKLTFSGSYALNGALNISFINGFIPTSGQTFSIITASSFSGNFSSVSWPSGYSGTVTVNSGSVELSMILLPVELTDFKANRFEGKSLLTWRTASELNNEAFQVERSSDGNDWQTLATLPGHGTTQAEQAYSFTDERPQPGVNYYRLKQVDFDGQSEYSKVVSVEFPVEGEAGMRLFPNPVRQGELTLFFPEIADENSAILCLYDSFGKLAKQMQVQASGAAFDVRDLPPGIYLAKLSTGKGSYSERLVIAH